MRLKTFINSLIRSSLRFNVWKFRFFVLQMAVQLCLQWPGPLLQLLPQRHDWGGPRWTHWPDTEHVQLCLPQDLRPPNPFHSGHPFSCIQKESHSFSFAILSIIPFSNPPLSFHFPLCRFSFIRLSFFFFLTFFIHFFWVATSSTRTRRRPDARTINYIVT